MKHEGLHVHRLLQNPRELVFAEAWRKDQEVSQKVSKASVLYTILNAPDATYERDAQVAATVIQWLGSPVGFCWLVETLEKAGYTLSQEPADEPRRGM